jgi:MoxR-like ATPase
MFNVFVDYLPEDEEVAVVTRTTSGDKAELQPLFAGSDLVSFRSIVQSVPIAEDVARYAVRLAATSRPQQAATPEFINEWVSWGAGLRAGQYLVLGAKVKALLDGKSHVSIDDIRHVAHPVMRHRILINYRAEADGISTEQVIDRLLETVQPPG